MKTLSKLDFALFILLLFFLLAVVAISGMANLQTDSIDYYALIQRLVGDTPSIVPNLPFLEQRSPGYPLLSLPLYFVLDSVPVAEAQPAPSPLPDSYQDGVPPTSETAILPSETLRIHDILLKPKDIDLYPIGSTLRWQILLAMLLTSYALFFSGLFASARTLAMLYPTLPGYSLGPLTVVTSVVFMHNLVQTPAYATLTAFGVSCWATYCWVRAWKTGLKWAQLATGITIGTLALVRLETVLLIAICGAGLLLTRRWRFLVWFVVGGLIPLMLLLVYNILQFGNPFYAGILRGNMNILTMDAKYVLSGLINPQSGMIWYSTLILLGLAGIILSNEVCLKILGWGGLVLIILVMFRVPVMYFCVGEGTQTVEGVVISCPQDWQTLLQLIRFDVNRYIIPLVPFTVLGLRGLLTNITKLTEKIK